MRKGARQQPQNGQKESSDERKPFVFRGGNLALDLVNTEVMVRGKKHDLLVTAQDAAQWWEMALQAHPQVSQEQRSVEWSEQQASALRTLRSTLRHLFEALAAQRQTDEHDLTELNTFLREGYYTLNVSPEGKVYAIYQTRHEGNSVLLTIALAAMQLLTERDLSRLRACQSSRCMLLFYDTTKSATRHWCSVACTNRARSIQNYRRAKGVSIP